MAYCLWKYYPELPVVSSILITDIESVLSDATNANNHVKFKWKLLRKQVPFTVPRLLNIFNQVYTTLSTNAPRYSYHHAQTYAPISRTRRHQTMDALG